MHGLPSLFGVSGMMRHTPQVKKSKRKQERQSVHHKITERIIDQLQQEQIPWQRPWSRYAPAHNLISKKRYRGINALVLNDTFTELRPYYLTFNQVKALGGRVKKGSKSFPVVYFNYNYTRIADDKKLTEDEAKQLPKNEVERTSFLKNFNVFSIDQTEGVVVDIPQDRLNDNITAIDSCEALIEHYSVTVRHQGDQAFYLPRTDTVTMPPIERFDTAESYYSTLFHELIHSTGASTRLSRSGITDEKVKKNSPEYAFEELVAEIGTAFLCSHLGISSQRVLDNQTAYIQGWISKLNDNPQWIIKASAQAQKAVDLLLGDG